MAKSTPRKTGQKRRRRTTLPAAVSADDRLLNELRALIDAGREQAARAVNSALIGLYWQIGRRIRQDILQEQRAEYGQQIVTALSARLTAEYGKGFIAPTFSGWYNSPRRTPTNKLSHR